MEYSEPEKHVRDELIYRLLLAKHSSDEPIVQAYMLKELKNAYIQHNMSMSPKIKEFISKEVKRISEILERELHQKKAEYGRLIDKKRAGMEKHHNSIFDGTKFE